MIQKLFRSNKNCSNDLKRSDLLQLALALKRKVSKMRPRCQGDIKRLETLSEGGLD